MQCAREGLGLGLGVAVAVMLTAPRTLLIAPSGELGYQRHPWSSCVAISGVLRKPLTHVLRRLLSLLVSRIITCPTPRAFQALLAAATANAAAENERIVQQVRDEAVEAHRAEKRAQLTAVAQAVAAAAAAAAATEENVAEQKRAEMAALYEQYQLESLSEVDKLKAERKKASQARRAGADDSGSGGIAENLIAEAPAGGGDIQGLQWCVDTLKRDADGDEAHGFFVVHGLVTAAVIVDDT